MRQVFLDKRAFLVKEVSQPLLDDSSVLIFVHYSFLNSGAPDLANILHMPQQSCETSSRIKNIVDSVVHYGKESVASFGKRKIKGEVQTLKASCAGVVVAVGKKVTRWRTGDLVACAGVGHHADVVCIPENLAVRVSEQEFLKPASLTTYGAMALQGIRRANLQIGEQICVLGLGLLGQLTVQLAKIAGCKVIAVDLLEDRVALARELGADIALRISEHDCKNEIDAFTGHYGVDATIITASSKSDAIIQDAFEFTRKKGRVVLVGNVGLDLGSKDLHRKEIDFLVSCSYGPGRYDPLYEQKGQDYPYAFVRWTENRNMQAFVELIESKRLVLDKLLEREVALEDVSKIYQDLQSKKIIGAVIHYSPHKMSLHTAPDATSNALKKETGIQFTPAVNKSLRVGVVGVGGFAKVKLMPILSKMNNIKINAFVDANITNSLNVCQRYRGAKALGADEELFSEDLVDVVVISSPHKFHCDQSLRALNEGKAVFVEKPMITDFEQFNRLTSFLKRHPHLPFCVDYNRSFSPFIQKIKAEVSRRNSPLVVQYRMNAGFMAGEHWMQTDIGAGRVIGEACHIFDLFYFLTDSEPVSVSVEAIHVENANIFPTDNFGVHIRFQDGSLCSLLYTALGHEKLGKERMEVFFDSKSIVMDDYVYLAGFGLPKSFDETVAVPDRGHEALLHIFFKHVHTKPFNHPISLDRLAMVAKLTLIVDQLVCEGGGDKELSL